MCDQVRTVIKRIMQVNSNEKEAKFDGAIFFSLETSIDSHASIR